MSNFKLRALMGASALVAVSALSMGANAATLYGGGSTLLAPAWAQLKFCWDKNDNNDLVGGVQTPVYLNKPAGGIVVPTHPTTPTCTNTPGTGTAATLLYVGSGSGAGQAAVFAHNGSLVPSGSTIPLLGFDPGGVNPEVTAAEGIQYGLSDNALAQADLDVYNFGTGHATAPTTPSTYQGVAVTAAKPKYGALVQFPVSIDPVDLVYNPSSLTTLTGTLVLDKTAYCGIYQGTITNWNDSHLAAINTHTGSDLTGGVSVPIKVIGRLDSSGTTAIFTRNLAQVCGSSTWTAGTTTLPTGGVLITYDLQTGSNGVGDEISAQAGGIGYIGNDYIVTSNVHSLPAAKLINTHGDTVAPSGSAAAIAFGGLTAPATTDSNQLDWVAGPTNATLGNPTATGAYPIVGTTNFIGYTCYASVNTVDTLRDMLGFTYNTATGKGADLITAAGLAPLPATWVTNIKGAFLNGNNTSTLWLAEASATGRTDTSGIPSHKNTTCTVSGVVGG